MGIKIAINGYGRIGRNILRAIFEQGLENKLEIVAINDLSALETNVHLTNFDSTHGRFMHTAEVAEQDMLIKSKRIKVFKEKDINNLPWRELKIDIVMECTGIFTNKDRAGLHLIAGAKKVLISAPSKDADVTVVYGVNHDIIKPEHTIVSNASCTTNCLAPLVHVLHKALIIQHGLMTTVHSYTNDQVLCDVSHADLRRARSATQSMIPTKTGAAAAIGLVLPELAGKLDGCSLRVPTMNVSIVDLTVKVSRNTNVAEVNAILSAKQDKYLSKVIEINDLPLVSKDFNHNSASSIFDLTQTQVIDDMVKVFSWYDNEWGFSNRMLDVCLVMMQ